ncbi:Protein of unknown function [Flavobacterium indicum GPTSA100-9 = DSM 17447]|uniref:Uncharacterized protein n=1 Tax=Flavobacterium indicum (strain DSM 17447 / CIP 109464 / GPTSA100-9) TaxID=1094466 RepID=H8XV12_FLAIG|nr:hypothetical protein [Flavobacterium indicum]CCG52279.1 Protein of unknown function [Flavobacterium indicum GPTSA100-9 = DSM 17447]CCG52977.1 Protein of unknown function [Flavobacterium indicum GPTSA100-9 = DSM 17447]CCG52982.1 Protein of unknown function [Flavobacterium indicum GPTSA100-9 = DSM 17447]
MKKLHLIILIFTFNFGLSQTNVEIDSLLNEIAKIENSKEIINTNEGKKIIGYGWKLLPKLSEFFTDKTETNVKSECVGRNLTKGEIAIILADRIEGMPYAQITGIQNCLATFCEKNMNFIEYYVDFIKSDGIEKFQAKYNEWLKSDANIEWKPIFDLKSVSERKKIIKEKRKAKQK